MQTNNSCIRVNPPDVDSFKCSSIQFKGCCAIGMNLINPKRSEILLRQLPARIILEMYHFTDLKVFESSLRILLLVVVSHPCSPPLLFFSFWSECSVSNRQWCVLCLLYRLWVYPTNHQQFQTDHPVWLLLLWTCCHRNRHGLWIDLPNVSLLFFQKHSRS